MKTRYSLSSSFALLSSVLALSCPLHASGIPEPGIILYGEVRNLATAFTNRPRMTFGELDWPLQAGGKTLRLRVGLTNLGGNLSYRVRIPFETVVGGNTEGPTSFVLNTATAEVSSLTNAIVYRSGTNAVVATLRSFSAEAPVTSMAVYRLAAGSRGVVQRVDLGINSPGIPPARNGAVGALLPSWGESGGGSGIGELEGFQFTAVGAHPEGGVQVDWSGAPTGKMFYLLRAEVLDEGVGQYGIVRIYPKGSPSKGSFRDTEADPEGTYFYRLWAE